MGSICSNCGNASNQSKFHRKFQNPCCNNEMLLDFDSIKNLKAEVERIESLESVCRELGEALEEAVKIEKYLIPDNGCPHAPDSPCDNLCAEEAEYEKAILRHKEALTKWREVEKNEDLEGRAENERT